jgi:hypothetical protein
MKRTLLTVGMLIGMGIGGGAWVSAQTPAAPKAGEHDHAAASMGGGGMCQGMMGGGMMGSMPMGPMAMMGADARMEV